MNEMSEMLKMIEQLSERVDKLQKEVTKLSSEVTRTVFVTKDVGVNDIQYITQWDTDKKTFITKSNKEL